MMKWTLLQWPGKVMQPQTHQQSSMMQIPIKVPSLEWKGTYQLLGGRFPSTPAGRDSNYFTQSSVDVSVMVKENLEATRLIDGEILTHLELDRRIHKAHNSSLHQHIKNKLHKLQTALSTILEEKFRSLHSPDAVVVEQCGNDFSSNAQGTFDEDWHAAAAAASSETKHHPTLFPHISSPPPTNHFRATSPVRKFHGYPVNLDAIEEGSHQSSHRSPTTNNMNNAFGTNNSAFKCHCHHNNVMTLPKI